MVASELISDTLPAVKLTDTVSHVLDWMNEFKITQLPVISGTKLYGIIKENDLLDSESDEAAIKDSLYLDEHAPHGQSNLYVLEGKHLYEVLSLMSKYKLEILPVCDINKHYLGVITIRDIVQKLGDMFAVNEEGSILVVETQRNNYSLGEIGRIVESTNATVLSLYIYPVPDSNILRITLKVNVLNPSRIAATFERYKYAVAMSYYHLDNVEDYKQNLDLLFKLME